VKSLVDDVLVAIPWFGRDPRREAALAWVARRWVDNGFPSPSLGVPNGDDWCKAEAVANAIAHSDAPILVLADADVWCDGVQDAIDRVRQGAPWARPHRLVYRLSPTSTQQVLAGTNPYPGMELDPDEPTARRPGRLNEGYGGVDGGGIVVVRRDIYDDVPLDPRYIGWGHEDVSWAAALTKLHGGPVRFGHNLWHLWHPPQPRLGRGFGSLEEVQLHQRYVKARTPELMRALIDEAKGVSCSR
jgi:hypothetical protein